MKAHNGVRSYDYVLDNREVNITSTERGLLFLGCESIHNPNSHHGFSLMIDGHEVRPPLDTRCKQEGIPFLNERLGIFDTQRNAFTWAHYVITGSLPAGEEVRDLMESHIPQDDEPSGMHPAVSAG